MICLLVSVVSHFSMQPFISTGVGSILVVHCLAPHSGVKYSSSWKSFVGLVLSCEGASEDSEETKCSLG